MRWQRAETSYVANTTDMDTIEAERELKKQADIFVQERDYLISIY